MAAHAATTPTASVPTRSYAGNLPECQKCNFHHKGSCWEIRCKNCNRKGHTTRFYRVPTRQVTQDASAKSSQTRYSCGETGHFKRECPRARDVNADSDGRVLVINAGETLPEPPMDIGTFPNNDIKASDFPLKLVPI